MLPLSSPMTNGGRIYKMFSSRLEKLGIHTFEDFLLHIPSRYEDYSIISKIANIQQGEQVTLQGSVLDSKNQYLRRGRIKTIQKIILSDDTGSIELTWFNQPFILKNITQNTTLSVSGRVQKSKKTFTIASPDYEVLTPGESAIHTGRLIPVYPETKGISSKWLRRQIYNLLIEYKDELTEYIPETILKKHHLMPYAQAIHEIHFPKNVVSADMARSRLGFDEFFLMQLAATQRRKSWQKQTRKEPFKIKEHKDKIDRFISSLPFALTNAQHRSVSDLLDDLSETKAMNRLLQGDVGSGKTVVATIVAYLSYLNGYQSVFMAPTEILANQHFKTMETLLAPYGVTTRLVTGNKKYLDSETFNILIGTHAVLSDKINFTKLGFIIIDEQQRFGVNQRGLIRQRGNNPHLLTMTATPIPRTIALTMYGDLDVSYLNEMPIGRKKVKTWLVPPEKRNGAYEWIRKQVTQTNSQVFIICPFIEESENMQTVKAATIEYEKLQKNIFPELRIGLLHGKLTSKQKDTALQEFREKKFDILVATPVVEVGIDIPNATVIMIEAAERFGLSQLHQLRGRVGRGDKQSYCLLFSENANPQTTNRLKSLETVYSGAELAEIDLKLRGPGTLYGTLQHGIPKLKAASFSDIALIQQAKQAADEIFPTLSAFVVLSEKLKKTATDTVSPD